MAAINPNNEDIAKPSSAEDHDEGITEAFEQPNPVRSSFHFDFSKIDELSRTANAPTTKKPSAKPRVSGSSSTWLQKGEEEGVFHLDSETLMMYMSELHKVSLLHSRSLLMLTLSFQVHDNYAKLGRDGSETINSNIYSQILRGVSDHGNGMFKPAVRYLIAAEIISMYRPTLAELTRHNYKMEIIEIHQRITKASINMFVQVRFYSMSKQSKVYLDFLQGRAVKLSNDWEDLHDAYDNPPAPRATANYVDGGANVARNYFKVLLKSASRADLRGSFKRVLGKKETVPEADNEVLVAEN